MFSGIWLHQKMWSTENHLLVNWKSDKKIHYFTSNCFTSEFSVKHSKQSISHSHSRASQSLIRSSLFSKLSFLSSLMLSLSSQALFLLLLYISQAFFFSHRSTPARWYLIFIYLFISGIWFCLSWVFIFLFACYVGIFLCFFLCVVKWLILPTTCLMKNIYGFKP